MGVYQTTRKGHAEVGDLGRYCVTVHTNKTVALGGQ